MHNIEMENLPSWLNHLLSFNNNVLLVFCVILVLCSSGELSAGQCDGSLQHESLCGWCSSSWWPCHWWSGFKSCPLQQLTARQVTTSKQVWLSFTFDYFVGGRSVETDSYKNLLPEFPLLFMQLTLQIWYGHYCLSPIYKVKWFEWSLLCCYSIQSLSVFFWVKEWFWGKLRSPVKATSWRL